MRYQHIPYEAFGERGEYVRDAREIGELPWEMRAQALRDATTHISGLVGRQAVRAIPCGTPAYRAFDMRPADAKRHEHAALLMTLGTHIPLTYCS
ncbi:hypothetical protein [Ralstonia insidiosa]|jgi:hypothetical protein|nr:hypothetical protein [Ralstonia insidiosa]MBA9939832.1 hypothetical protein [Ralstonia insidiosa]MBC9968498.1 hypothetical protein [Ralstonia insidiosa]MBX3904681.1 hypothetical protein [Ralstonia insidiosa]